MSNPIFRSRVVPTRMIAVLGALVSGTGCDERLGPVPADELAITAPAQASVATGSGAAVARGIPFGTFAQPTTAFGPLFNGANLTLKPWEVLPTLAAIRARGGRAVVGLAGNKKYYVDANGHFSLKKWKARVDRVRSKAISSYIEDGTIVAHFLLDEPNDPGNWNGKAVPPSVVEAMAQYSKQIWPKMPTVVRTEPTYLARWRGNFRYLDAAWAQYVDRRGDIDAFLSRNVNDARRKGLALVIGLNILEGGPGLSPMTASQVRSWGSRLLRSSYPCAFLSWKYDDTYLSSSSVREAMSTLRKLAQNRQRKTCRGS